MQLPCRRLRRPRRVLRHGPAASCSAAMASRVSVSGMPGDASPDPATTSVATTVPASIKDCYLSRRAPRAFRRSREAAALPCSMPMPPVLTGRPMAHPSIRPRRLKCGDVTNPCLPVHHPGPVQNALPFRKRHLDVDSRKLRLPRPCRIPADCPVARSGRDGSRPTAPGRPQTASVYRWHQGGTRTECLAALPPKGPRCV